MKIKDSKKHMYALERLNRFLLEYPMFKYIDYNDYLTINDWKKSIYFQLKEYCISKDALWDIFDAAEYRNVSKYTLLFIPPTEDKILTIINTNVY